MNSATPCTIKKGEVAVLTKKGLVYNNIIIPDHKDCFIEPGAIIRLHYSESKQKQNEAKMSATDPVAAPVPAPVAEAEAPVAAPVPPIETVEASSEVADISAAADAAANLGGDYAPIVGIALAAMAILGGKQAWSFYKERNERKHELEMTKLKLQSQDPNKRPHQCKTAQVEIDKRFEELEAKLSKLERKSIAIDTDEVDDMMRKVRKLERAFKDANE